MNTAEACSTYFASLLSSRALFRLQMDHLNHQALQSADNVAIWLDSCTVYVL